jgi:hypothetical protein
MVLLLIAGTARGIDAIKGISPPRQYLKKLPLCTANYCDTKPVAFRNFRFPVNVLRLKVLMFESRRAGLE